MNTRHRTRDRTHTADYYTVESLGPKQSLTPEGFLLCKDVPLARTGDMVYGPGEVPVEPGPDGLIHIKRGKDELLKPETIASFNGKPVTDEHPDDDVTPKTWRKQSRGVVLNPRATTAEDDDTVGLIVADLLVTDPDTIEAVKSGKREVSCGYDADYEDLGGGQGTQQSIIGNHVALVEKGRCGPRCAIGDHHHTTAKEQHDMATKNPAARRRASLSDKVRKAFRDAAEGLVEELDNPVGADEDSPGMEDDTAGGGGDGHTHVHVHLNGAEGASTSVPSADEFDAPGDMDDAGGGEDPTEARFRALEAGHEEIKGLLAAIMEKMGMGGGGEDAPPDEGGEEDEVRDSAEDLSDADTQDELPEEDDMDGKVKTGDSAALATSYQRLLSDAEVLVPGFRMPTFDAKLARKKTVDAMCNLRRRVLDAAYATRSGAELLEGVHGGPLQLAHMSCASVATVFKTAATAKKLLNNSQSTKDAERTAEQNKPAPRKTVADLQAAFAAHYKV